MIIYFCKALARNPEIRYFCQISEDWSELGIQNVARMSLIKCYQMSQNTRVTFFTVFELLRDNQQGGVKLPPRLGLNSYSTPTKVFNTKKPSYLDVSIIPIIFLFLTSYSLRIHSMLIFIFIDIQYLENFVFSFKNVSNGILLLLRFPPPNE